MKKLTKNLLFYFFLILFFIFGPVLCLLSLGYKFNFEDKKLVQTGGIYIKAEPQKINLYLDGKFINSTDFLTGSFFIKNLLPKTYNIKIEKQGYQSWEKNLEIKEKIVSETKEIILMPNKLSSFLINQNAEDFFVSPSFNRIVILENERTSLRFLINEINKNLEESKILGEFLFDKIITSKDINKIYWSLDENKLLLNTKKGFFLLEIPDKKKFKLVLDPTIEITGFLSNDEISYLDANGVLIIYNLTYFTSKIVRTKNMDCILETSDFICLDKEGFVKRINKEGEINKIFNLEPIKISKEGKYQIFFEKEYLIIRENKKLYLLNPENKFVEIENNLDLLSSSPDNKKIAIISNTKSELNLFYLKKDYQQPIKLPGQKNKILENENLLKIFWYDRYHFFIQKPNEILFVETDNRDNINLFKIIEKPIKKAFFDKGKKAFYVLGSEEKDLLIFFGF